MAASKYTPNADSIVRSILENINVAEPPIHLNRPTVFDAKTGTNIGLAIGSSGIMAWNGPGDPTTTPTIRTVVISAVDGGFAFGKVRAGGDASHQLIFDPAADTFFIGSNIKVESVNQTLAAIAANANYGATRSVGDVTATILANSGTTIQGYSSTLFKFVNGAFELDIGAGGLFAKKNGVPTFSISGATGEAAYGGIVSTEQYVLAQGNTPVSGTIYGTIYPSFVSMPSSTNPNAVGLYAKTNYGHGVIGVSGGVAGVTGIATASGGFGVLGSATVSGGIGVYAGALSGETAFYCNGKMTKTGTELVSNLNADLLDGYHANTLPIDLSQISVGSTGVKFQYGTDNVNWANIYLKRANW